MPLSPLDAAAEHAASDAWIDFAERLPRPVSLAIASGLVVLFALGDYLTGPDVSFLLLYLAPVGFATWCLSLRAGFLFSVACAVVSVVVDVSARIPLGTVQLPGPAVVGWNLLVQFGVFLALAVLLAALKSRLLRERRLARTDALTQVPNRRAFFESAHLELERARRHGRPITFAYVDCDDFKFVNDALGHSQGDELLVVVAQTLRSTTRVVDAVARLGGDEFGLLLPETDGETARTLLARVRSTLLAAMARHGWNVGFSIGAATFGSAPHSVDDMMARADALMYEAKRTAKGSVRLEVVATPALPTRTG